MGVYRLSGESESDIASIYSYGIKKFGILQAKNYLMGLHDLFETLAINPNIGWDTSVFSSSLKRFSYKSHIIFYTNDDSGILIVRVLHQSMDYQRHL